MDPCYSKFHSDNNTPTVLFDTCKTFTANKQPTSSIQCNTCSSCDYLNMSESNENTLVGKHVIPTVMGEEKEKIFIFPRDVCISSVIAKMVSKFEVQNSGDHEAFFVVNLTSILSSIEVIRKFLLNEKNHIKPYFSLRKNSCLPLVKLMLFMNMNLSVSSKEDIQLLSSLSNSLNIDSNSSNSNKRDENQTNGKQVKSQIQNTGFTILSSPLKQNSLLRRAKEQGVTYIIVDSESDLEKIKKENWNDARLLIRTKMNRQSDQVTVNPLASSIQPNSEQQQQQQQPLMTSQIPQFVNNSEFVDDDGVNFPEMRQIIERAKALDLEISGISIVSSSLDIDSNHYSDQKIYQWSSKYFLDLSHTVNMVSAILGQAPQVVDLGTFAEPSQRLSPIHDIIEQYFFKNLSPFSSSSSIQLLMDFTNTVLKDSHYFVGTVAAKKSKKVVAPHSLSPSQVSYPAKNSTFPVDKDTKSTNFLLSHQREMVYHLQDGVLDYFQGILYNYEDVPNIYPVDMTLITSNSNPILLQSQFFGSSSNEQLDKICEGVWIPELDVGDWIFFPHSGMFLSLNGNVNTYFILFDTKQTK